jgi:spore coat polysaccharide biosynthesis predicted glycosyltransferase SpsG
MSQKKVLFRCDAGSSPEIGTGHIIRCLTLADYLVGSGFVGKDAILFLTRNDAEFNSGIQILEKRKYSYKAYSDYQLAANSQKEIDTILSAGVSLVVMDRLNTSSELVASLQKENIQVVTFDDYGSGRLIADIAICAIFDDVDESPNLYKGYPYLILSGNKYHPQKPHSKVKSICATFGGFDARDLCTFFIDCLDTITDSISIDIVLGNTKPNLITKYNYMIRNLERENQVTIHVQPSNYHEIISNTSLAISSGGLSIFELAAWGIPTIGLPQYEHQLRTIYKLQEDGIAAAGSIGMALDKNKLQAEIMKMINENEVRQKKAQLAHKLIDGQGLRRVLNILTEKVALKPSLLCGDL